MANTQCSLKRIECSYWATISAGIFKNCCPQNLAETFHSTPLTAHSSEEVKKVNHFINTVNTALQQFKRKVMAENPNQFSHEKDESLFVDPINLSSNESNSTPPNTISMPFLPIHLIRPTKVRSSRAKNQLTAQNPHSVHLIPSLWLIHQQPKTLLPIVQDGHKEPLKDRSTTIPLVPILSNFASNSGLYLNLQNLQSP